MSSRELYCFRRYFLDVYDAMSPDEQLKTEWLFDLVRRFQFLSQKYLKSITGYKNLFELRIGAGRRIFRVFCCMDEGNIIILFNGFIKKSDKTPQKEIERAVRIQKEYEAAKSRSQVADFLQRAP